MPSERQTDRDRQEPIVGFIVRHPFLQSVIVTAAFLVPTVLGVEYLELRPGYAALVGMLVYGAYSVTVDHMGDSEEKRQQVREDWLRLREDMNDDSE